MARPRSSGTCTDKGTHLQSVEALHQGFSASKSGASSASGIFKYTTAFSSSEACSSTASRTQQAGSSSGFHSFIFAINL